MRFSDLSLVPLSGIPAPPYSSPEDPLAIYAAAKSMESLCRASSGMGLAAAQVGLPWNMFVYLEDYPSAEQKFGCLVDCSYEPLSESKSPSIEGCLSLPGERYRVDRYERVRVSGLRLVEMADGVSLAPFDFGYSGVMAVLMQHEIDHGMGRERMIDVIGRRVRPA